MADLKKSQKAGRAGGRNAGDAKDPTAEKTKNRDKYKTDVPLQTNQSPARPQWNGPSTKAGDEWANAAPKETDPTTGDITIGDIQNESENPMDPDIEDIYTREVDFVMSQGDEDEAYYEYMMEQEGDNEMILNFKDHMWSIPKELKRKKESPSWNKIDFFKSGQKA